MLDDFTNRRSDVINEIITDTPSWILLWGNAVIALLMILIAGLSYFIQYPDILYADAIVTSTNPPNQIVANSSGNLIELFVNEGDTIAKGDPLAIIDNNAVYSDVIKLQKILDLTAMTSGTMDFKFYEFNLLILGDIEDDFANFLDAYNTFLTNERTDSYSNDQNTVFFSLLSMDGQLSNLKEQKENFSKIQKIQQQDLQRTKLLHEKGVISDQEYQRQESQYLEDQTSFKNTEIMITRLENEKNTVNNSRSNAEINKEVQDAKISQKTILTLRQLKEAIANWKKQYVLSSNIDGVVSISNFWSKGQYVKKNQAVFYVLPTENQSIRAILRLKSHNYGKIEKYQRVHLSLENYPEEEFGLVEGQVMKLGKIPNIDGTYPVEVELPVPLKSTYGYEIFYTPEMVGRAEIITKKASVLQHFFWALKKAAK